MLVMISVLGRLERQRLVSETIVVTGLLPTGGTERPSIRRLSAGQYTRHDILEAEERLVVRQLYDIYGFVIAVEGAVNRVFEREYGRLKTSPESAERTTLHVKPVCGKPLPTRPLGSKAGVYLPVGEDEDVLWYSPSVPPDSVLSYCEALMHWEHKALLHSSAVAQNGKAYLFIGPGSVGKTSICLNLVRKGYLYLNDDWSIIGDGMAYPFPKRVHVMHYNLKDDRLAKNALGWKRFHLSGLLRLLELGEAVAPHRYVRLAFQVLKPTFNIDIQDLLPGAEIGPPSQIARIFYLERWDEDSIRLESADSEAEELARRMSYANLYERAHFFTETFRYAMTAKARGLIVHERFQHDLKIILDTIKGAHIFRLFIPRELDLTAADVSSLPLD